MRRKKSVNNSLFYDIIFAGFWSLPWFIEEMFLFIKLKLLPFFSTHLVYNVHFMCCMPIYHIISKDLLLSSLLSSNEKQIHKFTNVVYLFICMFANLVNEWGKSEWKKSLMTASFFCNVLILSVFDEVVWEDSGFCMDLVTFSFFG